MRFMMVAVGLMNSLIRIIGDPYLRYKLKTIICTRRCGMRHIDDMGSEYDMGTEANESISEAPTSPHLGKRDTSVHRNMRLSQRIIEDEMLDKIERQVEELQKMRNSKVKGSMFEGEAKIPLQSHKS